MHIKNVHAFNCMMPGRLLKKCLNWPIVFLPSNVHDGKHSGLTYMPMHVFLNSANMHMCMRTCTHKVQALLEGALLHATLRWELFASIPFSAAFCARRGVHLRLLLFSWLLRDSWNYAETSSALLPWIKA